MDSLINRYLAVLEVARHSSYALVCSVCVCVYNIYTNIISRLTFLLMICLDCF